jgi:3-methyladenine DNA glycosylase AlkD
MTLKQVMAELDALGTAQTKKTFLRHGAKEPLSGVKIGDLKLVHKKIKGDQVLAMQLFDTGHAEAQYLAGMVADGRKMTPEQLQKWVENAAWSGVWATTCAWVTSEHPDGIDLALQWIDSPVEKIAIAGWATLSAIVITRADETLPMKQISSLLDRIAKALKASPDNVRYAMNGFVISCGTYVLPLAEKAVETARKLGKVEVDMGDTACKVPDAESYILKSRKGATVAPKRKTVRC